MLRLTAISLAFLSFAIPPAWAQAIAHNLPNDEAGQMSRTLLLFHKGLQRRDLQALKESVAKDGVYVSRARRVFMPSEMAELADTLANPSSQQPWDEKTSIMLQTDLVQKLTPAVWLVHNCEIQPSLMTQGEANDIVLVKEDGEWRIASISFTGACHQRIHFSMKEE